MIKIIILFCLLLISCKKDIEERVEYSKFSNDKIESKCQYIKGTNTKNGFCIEYDLNGNVIGEFQYRLDKLHGEQKYYHDNGNISEISHYSNDRLHGIKTMFYENNIIESTSEYKKGVLWNIYLVQDKDGNPLDFGDFKNGNGIVNVYYDDGRLNYRGGFKNGKAHGKWLYITDTGAKDTIVYTNGLNDWGYEVIFY